MAVIIVAYIIVALISIYLLAKYDETEKQDIVYIIAGIIWPITLIHILILLLIIFAQHSRGGNKS